MDYGSNVERTRMRCLQSASRTGIHRACDCTYLRRLTALTIFSVLIACGPQRGTVGVRFGRGPSGDLFAREVPAGLGAAKAGMQAGDQVILIDGRDVRPLSDAAIHSILSGERGTRVRVTVLRGQQVLRFAIERTPPPPPPKSSR